MLIYTTLDGIKIPPAESYIKDDRNFESLDF